MPFSAALNSANASRQTSPGVIPIKLNRDFPRRKLQLASLANAVGRSPAGLTAHRWLQPIARRHGAPGGTRNVLIVGAGPLGREMADILRREAGGLNVVGFLDENTGSANVLGRVEDLAYVARAAFVDEVIVTIPNQPDKARWVLREARRNRLDVKVVPDFYDLAEEGDPGHSPGPLALEYFGGVPVLTLCQRREVAASLLLKRALDLLFSIGALLALAPLLALIALAVKVTSRGQVIYQATRVGRKGRRFSCYKFRTMVANADRLKDSLRKGNEREGPCFKMVDDPRITRLGRWLRRYSLDELPQLWNVVRGEMSLVGPRPHPLDDFERYRLDHLRRLDVIPGITGLWQVTARRDPSFQRAMALDLEYIEHWNFWMDLEILWKTMFVVVQGSGA